MGVSLALNTNADQGASEASAVAATSMEAATAIMGATASTVHPLAPDTGPGTETEAAKGMAEEKKVAAGAGHTGEKPPTIHKVIAKT